MQIFHNPNYNFIRWRWHALGLSAAVIIAGAALMVTRGVPLGIDFSGGTLVRVQFEQQVTEDQVRRALDSIPGDKVVQQFGPASDRQIMIRLPQTITAEQGSSLEQGSRQIEEAITKAGLPKFQIVLRDIVGPVIGADLQRKGIYATLASIIAITIYIALRFRPSFAVGAIAATFHDILVTLAFLQFFKYELSLNIVAAILTITGYSVNDTIVIFDRVRENMRSKRREPIAQVVNTAVNQTLGRTIITAGTAFLSVLALYLFGGDALRGFSFTMLVGIISGTYSTIFIASAIAIILSKKQPTAAAPAAEAAARTTRKQKGAKAS
ncbi:MAG TPA: protein translocase subunit SecF [Vicinamibacterales bacterium]|jgi:preprotein translocase subunit SecF|nr:protein translocase subunit SecF [Vicinamibacterales bacterium]